MPCSASPPCSRSVTASVHVAAHPASDVPAAYAQHPALRALAEQTARVSRIGDSETVLMAKTEGALDQGVGNLRNVMRRTGINPDPSPARSPAAKAWAARKFRWTRCRSKASPIPASPTPICSAAAVLDQLNGLSAAMDHVPLAMPVPRASFDRSSGFGARVDPFTGRYAFHPGIDFAGPWGSAVHATAPGTVVFAGNRGGYGNMVEIDHGYRHPYPLWPSFRDHCAGGHAGRQRRGPRPGGFHRAAAPDPHVHYEVWYDDVVRNPSNFIEAGRHVL